MSFETNKNFINYNAKSKCFKNHCCGGTNYKIKKIYVTTLFREIY